MNGFGVEAQALAQAGYITFVVDARGTTERGKAFQDVVYHNFGRNEIPDHVAALKQLAAQRPYMDLRRVGITGGSWGGYFTIRAMLQAPDVYRVGVSVSPISELDESFWPIESYVGRPQDNKEGYEYASCLRMAGQLKGRLMMATGTDDLIYPSTLKMVEALVRAGKPYDLLVFPDQGHGFLGASGRYWMDALRRYFDEHLKPIHF